MTYDEKALNLWNKLYNQYKNHPPLKNTSNLWCSEWSWFPICDGNMPSKHENYPYYQIKDGIVFYATGTNYRVYAIWDLFKTKEECDKMCDRKGECSYSWEDLWSKKLTKYGLKSNPIKMEELSWIKTN